MAHTVAQLGAGVGAGVLTMFFLVSEFVFPVFIKMATERMRKAAIDEGVSRETAARVAKDVCRAVSTIPRIFRLKSVFMAFSPFTPFTDDDVVNWSCTFNTAHRDNGGNVGIQIFVWVKDDTVLDHISRHGVLSVSKEGSVSGHGIVLFQ